MANTRSTPVTFLKAVKLCLMLLISREQFLAEEQANNELLNSMGGTREPPERADIVRSAFIYGFVLVAASAACGWIVGVGLQFWLQCFNSKIVMWLQLLGTCFLLWGTLFVRGWDIQTFGGVSYTERVNQWLYRFLYCLGTALIVCSLVGSPCLG